MSGEEQFYVVWPASNGADPLVKGPFHCLKDAAEARQVNGDIVCRSAGRVKVADELVINEELVVPAIYRQGYDAVRSTEWLWDWEDEESSRFAYRYAAQGGLIT